MQDFYVKLEKQYKKIQEIKQNMTETLMCGLDKYPGDEGIRSWTQKFDEMFTTITPRIETSATKQGEGKNFDEEPDKKNDNEGDKGKITNHPPQKQNPINSLIQ